MKKKILVFLVLPLFFLLSFGFLLIIPTNAQTVDPTLTGLNQTAVQVDAFKTQTSSSYADFLQTKAGQIVGVVLSFVGVIFLILMIYAGITWMTASGNEQQVAKAKSLMINATIGIVIVFAAYAITSFIGIQVLK
ncbi:MAG TPA: hypothetical protein VFD16_01435 [Candidatus Saccharimonadales bacterium]|nr:hypothetical protein [Candidatus Saccharimonadales bacterium]